ncbi:heavy-metal-associated domain-containing protein [Pontibacter cellulosilyticus]|uniref:Heavy-metal-associated domain-containing protein n=1 Tax=Pontibacter cellulosilyticus TaxID=1720253 RepID=A0A923N9X3_9BACT|nr:heavy-metal-associated domain-containing protein [Pontibacter cellulosilyticus]MBC5994497.1 heavy-metal-associated domain-containing protein [Pontibacter cellulosilyticus]
MKELQFKTNINCGGCVSKVTPALDTAEGVCEWSVDTTNRDKVLTVKTDSLTASEVIATVEKAGFTAKEL